MSESGAVTMWLRRAAGGDVHAFDTAFSLVYAELRVLARSQLRREMVGHTLETGALVHEAYLRLSNDTPAEFDDRSHFLAIASSAMRRILVEHARRTHAAKRGGGAVAVDLDAADAGRAVVLDDHGTSLVDLDEALQRLAMLHERQAKVIECRFFGGLTEEETAAALGVGVRTVKRDWAAARAWLYRHMQDDSAR
ncbi:MAG: sigma-70 family RNA polymerase sigma factor [Gemmatimonadaceae bacterium]|nr:sigma-70 family RNA polymerase sigma factor [Gemmatimonadaceae bacterium]